MRLSHSTLSTQADAHLKGVIQGKLVYIDTCDSLGETLDPDVIYSKTTLDCHAPLSMTEPSSAIDIG